MIIFICYYKIAVNICKGDTMKKYVDESIKRTCIGFFIIMYYCIMCLIIKFSYIDLIYLLVVITYFVVFILKFRKI